MSDISDWMARHIDEVGINQDADDETDIIDIVTQTVVMLITIAMGIGCVLGIFALVNKHQNVNTMLEQGDTNLETTIYKETSSNPPWLANSFWKGGVK